MAMTQINSQWHDKRTTKKGDYGEELVQKFFEGKGYIVYAPVTDGAHGFDRILYKDEQYLALEIKTKPMCRKYPETGFNKYHYDRYLKLSTENNIKLFIAFVDEDKRAIYGNYLHELKKNIFVKSLGKKGHYPKITTHTGGANPTIYFHESSMNKLRNLNPAEVEKLKQLSGGRR